MSTAAKKGDGELRRVAVFLGNFAIGGAETQALELARRLPDHGWRPVFLLAERHGELIAEAERLGSPVHGLGAEFARSKANPLFWANLGACIRRAAAIMTRERCCVAHCLLFWQEPIAVPAARLARPVRAVVTSRLQSGAYRDLRPHYRMVQRMLNPFVDAVMVNSQGLRRDTLRRERLDPAKVHVIHNGVDCERFGAAAPAPVREEFPALRDAETIVAIVGRLKPEKRQDLFVRALALARREVPGLKALIVGADLGGYQSRVEAVVRELGQQEAVAFAGARRDVERCLAACDFLALTSDSEGMPNVLLEAMAAGKAVLSTRVFGAEEIVRPGTNGWLVPVGDVEAMAEKMVQLARDREARETMGRAGQRVVRRRLSLDAMVEAHARMYERLL